MGWTHALNGFQTSTIEGKYSLHRGTMSNENIG